MNDRTFAAYARWLDLAFPRAYGPHACLDRSTQSSLWRRSERAIAARTALAAAREGIVEAAVEGGAVVLEDRSGALTLPLARAGEFALHTADLSAARAPALERPAALLMRLGDDLAELSARARLLHELDDSVFNLAVAEASALCRARTLAAGDRWPAPVDPENLVIDGHPWHPMCKTRLGLGLAGVLRHAPENLSQGTFTSVDVEDALIQRAGDVEGWLARLGPPARPGWARVPVHVAQVAALRRLFPERWGRTIVPVAAPPRPARSLLSLRTVAVDDAALHLKLALAVITTSARRTVSAMSVHNGPPLTRLLARIQARDPRARGPLILGDVAAIGLRGDGFGDRAAHLGAILRPTPRDVVADALGEGHETWVCAALGESLPGSSRTLLAELAERHGGPSRLIADYVALLVPPLLRLLSAHGIALEAHLQNTLAIVGPRGLAGFVLRDLGGIRIHGPRLAAAGHTLDVAPGSFIVTDDLDEVRDKLAHTLFHAHLAAVFRWAEAALGVPAREGWAHVRAALDRHGDDRDDPRASGDRQALVADRVRSKALLRMRIDERISEYTYTRVDNVLAAPAVIARAEALRRVTPPETP